MDKISPERRSWNMAQIKSKNTKPELIIRKLLWNRGLRYRLNYKKLPGKPDIYIPKFKSAVFIHGCFWHQHVGCKRNFMPKSNIEYWEKKLKGNVGRFSKAESSLQNLGYKVIVIWECEIKDQQLVLNKLLGSL